MWKLNCVYRLAFGLTKIKFIFDFSAFLFIKVHNQSFN